MPTLSIQTPIPGGHEPRTVTVGGPAVLGRDEACEVQLLEIKASRRHARIAREETGAWVLEDLDSSNGTFVAGERVLRRRLADGAEIRIGDTHLVWREEAPAPLVGGRLALRAVGPAEPAAAPAPPPAPAAALPGAPPGAVPATAAAAEAEPESLPVGPPVVRVRPLDMRAFGRGLALFLVGLVGLLAVGELLGGKAERARTEATQRRALSDLLARADVDAKAFESLAVDFLARHPTSPDRALLERHLAAVRERAARRAGVEGRFAELMRRLGELPEDVLRGELLALERALPEDAGLAERVRLAGQELDRRRAAFERVEGERVLTEIAAMLDPAQPTYNPGAALRRASAWRSGRGLLSAHAAESFVQAEQRALDAVKLLSSQALAAAQAEADPARRRRVLLEVWPLVMGTFAEEQVSDALRYAASPTRRTPGTGPTPETPDPNAAGEALLAKAVEAERLFGLRRWLDARAAFEGVLQGTNIALLLQEWRGRISDLDLVLALADALGQAAKGEKPPRVTLGTGAAIVSAADRTGVTLTRGERAPERLAWEAVEPDDLLALLAPARPTREQRMGLAVLAASVSKPDALLAALVPLYEAGAPGGIVDALAARLLEGKPQAPEGGYRLHKGRLLDPTAHARVLEEERLDGLAERAGELLARLAKEPPLRRLERMRERRAELDRRRQYALLAIFNEKHYPYPYGRGQPPYIHVQAEVDRRVAAVRELWDGDDQVRLATDGGPARLCGEIGQLLAELEAKGRDVSAARADLDRTAPYLTGEAIRLRDFWLNEAERRLMAYNRRVLETYNPAQKGYAQDSEVVQVSITNAYRMMIGFSAQVAPGDAAYEAIDETNVAKILDQGRLAPGSVTHLRALRIDDRLVKSARLHSLDMQRRGYFDHFTKPDPATGTPRKSPFDRMREAGYEGHGASENIAQAGGPKEAHDSWCHSSGHHRNILSPWLDMGTGQAGGAVWTQNFGTGGGAAPAIAPMPADAPKR